MDNSRAWGCWWCFYRSQISTALKMGTSEARSTGCLHLRLDGIDCLHDIGQHSTIRRSHRVEVEGEPLVTRDGMLPQWAMVTWLNKM